MQRPTESNRTVDAMTSNDQAFVKTFSRRGRAQAKASSPTTDPIVATEPRSGDSGVGPGSSPQITRVDQPQAITPLPVYAVSPSASTPQTKPTTQSEGHRQAAAVAQRVADQQRQVSLQPTAVPAQTTAQPQVAAQPHGSAQPPVTGQPMATGQASVPTPAAPATQPTPSESIPTPIVPLTTERFDVQSPGPPVPHHKIVPPTDEAATDETVTAESMQHRAERTIEPFQAVWEVDVFDVPSRVADLFFDGRRYQQIAERMSAAVQTGLQSVFVTSVQSGEGRTSVAIGFAMAAAASGMRVALVDADTATPTLADHLRLDLQFGWVDTIRGGLPIKEIAVHAVEDGVTLIPLMPPQGQTAATPYEVTRLIETLCNHFDLLIIDGPTAESPGVSKIAGACDSAVLVRDKTRTGDEHVVKFSARLQEAGVQGVGIVDNFV